jgi:hypothetical protein
MSVSPAFWRAVFGVRITSDQPGEGAPHEGRGTRRQQRAMGDHHPLDRPREHARECRARCPPVDKTRTPVTRRVGMGGRANPADPGCDGALPLEPVARKILDQIGEQRRAAVKVEEDDLG